MKVLQSLTLLSCCLLSWGGQPPEAMLDPPPCSECRLQDVNKSGAGLAGETERGVAWYCLRKTHMLIPQGTSRAAPSINTIFLRAFPAEGGEAWRARGGGEPGWTESGAVVGGCQYRMLLC